MADYTSIVIDYNTGTDASPVWTGQALAFGGTSGANEIRWAASGAGAGNVASANWPYYVRPVSVTAVAELWAYTTNTAGSKIATYDGSNTASRVLRIDWDALGTLVSAPTLTAYSDSTRAAPVAGTQPGAQSGSPMINGQTTDTSNTSYLKGNAYGNGVTAGGVQHTPSAGAAGTTLAATSGTAGAATPAATPAWLSTWQSLQGAIQYIQNGAIPQSLVAGFWYFSLALFTGPNMSSVVGGMLPVLVYQYLYS